MICVTLGRRPQSSCYCPLLPTAGSSPSRWVTRESYSETMCGERRRDARIASCAIWRDVSPQPLEWLANLLHQSEASPQCGDDKNNHEDTDHGMTVLRYAVIVEHRSACTHPRERTLPVLEAAHIKPYAALSAQNSTISKPETFRHRQENMHANSSVIFNCCYSTN